MPFVSDHWSQLWARSCPVWSGAPRGLRSGACPPGALVCSGLGPGAVRVAPHRLLFLRESAADSPGLWMAVCHPDNGWAWLGVSLTLSLSLSLSLSLHLCLFLCLCVCFPFSLSNSFSLWGWVGNVGLGFKGCIGEGRGRECQAEGREKKDKPELQSPK